MSVKDPHGPAIRYAAGKGYAPLAVPHFATPFVGRLTERRVLTDALADAVRGTARLVLLEGEAGIGKTRLAAALLDDARDLGVTTASGAAWDDEGTPAFWPWRQAVRRLLEAEEPDLVRADVLEVGPDLVRIVPEVRDLVADLPLPLALEPK